MKALLLMPLIVPALTAALCLLFSSRPAWARRVGVGGTLVLLVIAAVLLERVARHGVQAVQIGNWPAPFGITIVADMLSAVMVLVAAIMGFTVMLYSLAEVGSHHQRFGFPVLLNTLLMGVCGAFLTGDMFNLFVWFEIILIASFVLVALGGEKAQIEGAVHYATMNIISSMLFLISVGILYATVQTLNMADLSLKLPGVYREHPNLLTALALLFIVAFGIKAAVFPLFFYLPASYHTPPASVSAIFAALLTKVGVYALIRTFTLVFPPIPTVYAIILIISVPTMLVGVLGAVSQNEVRRILSFHIVSQIGYLVLGLGLLVSPDPVVRRLALAGVIFYTVHVILAKSNLFLISGFMNAVRNTYELKRLGGLSGALPWLSVLFLISALSLAGLPPLSGFWAKLLVIKATLDAGHYFLALVALVTSLITLISMLKIWNEAFWKPPPDPLANDTIRAVLPRRGSLALYVGPIVLIAGLIVFIGLYPRTLYRAADRAAVQLLDTRDYIRVVQPVTRTDGDRKQAAVMVVPAASEDGGISGVQ